MMTRPDRNGSHPAACQQQQQQQQQSTSSPMATMAKAERGSLSIYDNNMEAAVAFNECDNDDTAIRRKRANSSSSATSSSNKHRSSGCCLSNSGDTSSANQSACLISFATIWYCLVVLLIHARLVYKHALVLVNLAHSLNLSAASAATTTTTSALNRNLLVELIARSTLSGVSLIALALFVASVLRKSGNYASDGVKLGRDFFSTAASRRCHSSAKRLSQTQRRQQQQQQQQPTSSHNSSSSCSLASAAGAAAPVSSPSGSTSSDEGASVSSRAPSLTSISSLSAAAAAAAVAYNQYHPSLPHRRHRSHHHQQHQHRDRRGSSKSKSKSCSCACCGACCACVSSTLGGMWRHMLTVSSLCHLLSVAALLLGDIAFHSPVAELDHSNCLASLNNNNNNNNNNTSAALQRQASLAAADYLLSDSAAIPAHDRHCLLTNWFEALRQANAELAAHPSRATTTTTGGSETNEDPNSQSPMASLIRWWNWLIHARGWKIDWLERVLATYRLELVSWLLAGVVLYTRYASVFWHTSKPLAFVVALVGLVACVEQLALLYALTYVLRLMRVQAFGDELSLRLHIALAGNTQSENTNENNDVFASQLVAWRDQLDQLKLVRIQPILLMREPLVLALVYALLAAVVHLSAVPAYAFAYAKYRERFAIEEALFVRSVPATPSASSSPSHKNEASTTTRACSSCSTCCYNYCPHLVATIQLVLMCACKMPFCYDLVIYYNSYMDTGVLFAILVEIVHTFVLLIVWLLLTLKSDWNMHLQVGLTVITNFNFVNGQIDFCFVLKTAFSVCHWTYHSKLNGSRASLAKHSEKTTTATSGSSAAVVKSAAAGPLQVCNEIGVNDQRIYHHNGTLINNKIRIHPGNEPTIGHQQQQQQQHQTPSSKPYNVYTTSQPQRNAKSMYLGDYEPEIGGGGVVSGGNPMSRAAAIAGQAIAEHQEEKRLLAKSLDANVDHLHVSEADPAAVAGDADLADNHHYRNEIRKSMRSTLMHTKSNVHSQRPNATQQQQQPYVQQQSGNFPITLPIIFHPRDQAAAASATTTTTDSSYNPYSVPPPLKTSATVCGGNLSTSAHHYPHPHVQHVQHVTNSSTTSTSTQSTDHLVKSFRVANRTPPGVLVLDSRNNSSEYESRV